MDDFLACTEATIARWHGVAVPNEQARRMERELLDIISAFERLRGTLRFEDEPSSFEVALRDAMEPS